MGRRRRDNLPERLKNLYKKERKKTLSPPYECPFCGRPKAVLSKGLILFCQYECFRVAFQSLLPPIDMLNAVCDKFIHNDPTAKQMVVIKCLS